MIIGNPPWGADIDDDIKYYEEHFPNSTQHHKDIYKIFIEKAINLLAEGGIFGFIVPNTILLQPRFKDIREYLNKFKLLYIINLGEKVFEGVEAPSCIIICQKSKRPKSHKVRILDLSFSKDNEFKADELRNPKYAELEQSIYGGNPDNAFVTYYRERNKDELSLGEILDCKDAGIKYQRINVGMREKGKNDLAERLFYEGERKSEKDYKYIIGKDLDRYSLHPLIGRYMKQNYKELLKNNEIVYFNKKYFDNEEKILWRQTSDIIRACIVGKVWFGNTLQVGISSPKYKGKIDLYYILVLINSKYLNYLYAQLVKETGRVFPQVKLSKIKQIPIKIISKKEQIPLVKLADKMLKLNKKIQKLDSIMDEK